eukprot:4968280-Prymnesium_polylepis.1
MASSSAPGACPYFVAPSTATKSCSDQDASAIGGVCSEHGLKPASSSWTAGKATVNQDVAVVARPTKDSVFLGVFDGHGEHGSQVARFACEHLVSQGGDGDLSRQFVECDRELQRSSVPSESS